MFCLEKLLAKFETMITIQTTLEIYKIRSPAISIREEKTQLMYASHAMPNFCAFRYFMMHEMHFMHSRTLKINKQTNLFIN